MSKNAGRERKASFPLQPVAVEEPFEQWGLDIIGEINPHSSKQHRYILTTTDYFTRWIEAIPLVKVNEEVVINFLEQHIITRFGIPNSLVFDNATYFSSLKLSEYALEKGIILKYSSNYYPQGNGLAESTNKNIICILKRTVVDHQRNWHNALQNITQRAQEFNIGKN
jgi:transposase InsO family protein